MLHLSESTGTCVDLVDSVLVETKQPKSIFSDMRWVSDQTWDIHVGQETESYTTQIQEIPGEIYVVMIQFCHIQHRGRKWGGWKERKRQREAETETEV